MNRADEFLSLVGACLARGEELKIVPLRYPTRTGRSGPVDLSVKRRQNGAHHDEDKHVEYVVTRADLQGLECAALYALRAICAVDMRTVQNGERQCTEEEST